MQFLEEFIKVAKSCSVIKQMPFIWLEILLTEKERYSTERKHLNNVSFTKPLFSSWTFWMYIIFTERDGNRPERKLLWKNHLFVSKTWEETNISGQTVTLKHISTIVGYAKQ